jgi:hypothetical protein
MKPLKILDTVLDRFVWMVGVMTMINHARDHWPTPYAITTVLLILGFGVWYLWRVFVQPLKAGMRGE